jgi:hypothetical protein
VGAYQPVHRRTAVLAWAPQPYLTVSAELGRDRGVALVGYGVQRASYAVLRMTWAP